MDVFRVLYSSINIQHNSPNKLILKREVNNVKFVNDITYLLDKNLIYFWFLIKRNLIFSNNNETESSDIYMVESANPISIEITYVSYFNLSSLTIIDREGFLRIICNDVMKYL